MNNESHENKNYDIKCQHRRWLYIQSQSVLSIFNVKSDRRFSHLLVTVGNVADFIPWEGTLGCQPVVWLIDVQTQGVHSQKKICSLFILNHISRGNDAFRQ